MLRALFRGIGVRIFIPMATLMVALIAIMSSLGYRFAQKTVTDNSANELRVLSVILTEQVQSYMKRVDSSMRSLTAISGTLDTQLQSTSARARLHLNSFLTAKVNQSSLFEKLGVFDEQGLCVSATDPEWVGNSGIKKEFFVAGLKKINFSELFEDKEYGDRVLLVSGPIGDPRAPRGVLVGRVNLEALYELMDQKIGVAGSSEAFLLDSQLRFITPAKSGPDELQKSHLARTPLVHHLKEEFWVGKYQNFAQEDVLGTVMKVEGYDWFIVIERDFAEIQKNLEEIKQKFLESAGVLSLGLILVSVILSLSITRPIQALVEDIRRVGTGDLTHPVVMPRAVEEIAYMATEFDKMRQQLAAYQSRLITRLEESEQKRSESERLAAIGTLASSLAHEIRNPLNGMSLLLTQLERSKDLPDSNRAGISGLRREIARLDRLVSEILDYAKPLHLERSLFSLQDLMNEIGQLYMAVFESRSLDFRLEMPESAILIWADRDRLKQALLNIVQNAIEISKANDFIAINIWRDDLKCRICIRDNGPGIPESVKPRLFDLFFTTKESGTGLGLTVVRKILDAHNGDVLIESRPGLGTEVILSLPLPARKDLDNHRAAIGLEKSQI